MARKLGVDTKIKLPFFEYFVNGIIEELTIPIECSYNTENIKDEKHYRIVLKQ